jgi:hypothetical protein
MRLEQRKILITGGGAGPRWSSLLPAKTPGVSASGREASEMMYPHAMNVE